MRKQSRWSKWKVGGGLVVSLAVLFQVAKADPAFGKAVQAAQENEDAYDSDDSEQASSEMLPVVEGDEDDDAVGHDFEGALLHDADESGKSETSGDEHPDSDDRRSTLPTVPAASMQTAVHKPAGHAPVSSTHTQKSTGSSKQTTASTQAKGVSTASSTAPKAATAVPSATKTPAPVVDQEPQQQPQEAPPADIPPAPEESTAAPLDASKEASLDAAPQSEESSSTKTETKKKKSHTKSRRS
ncbi:hypothetical protein [Brevibacillus choshinensis]|uniref:Uncharacterized protein n=1 Tax=Brevibacillus choshinensis TaxID=54911 RepID=A0ABX7FQH9_BRECH|nr:hypothetical protein [Brevibacillus choshinensis]QRG68055.1 hypothetical protein JNE38_02275 [Brevibacillus choshinensis]